MMFFDLLVIINLKHNPESTNQRNIANWSTKAQNTLDMACFHSFTPKQTAIDVATR